MNVHASWKRTCIFFFVITTNHPPTQPHIRTRDTDTNTHPLVYIKNIRNTINSHLILLIIKYDIRNMYVTKK